MSIWWGPDVGVDKDRRGGTHGGVEGWRGRRGTRHRPLTPRPDSLKKGTTRHQTRQATGKRRSPHGGMLVAGGFVAAHSRHRGELDCSDVICPSCTFVFLDTLEFQKGYDTWRYLAFPNKVADLRKDYLLLVPVGSCSPCWRGRGTLARLELCLYTSVR